MSPRTRLRATTRDAHADIDGLFGRLDLTRPDDYRRFLTAHALVLPGLEARLAASGAAELVPDWTRRARSAALIGDLLAVGGERPEGAAPGGTAVVGAPGSGRLHPAAVFGVLYVLEGSRLGGAVLARAVERNVDARCRGALAYLRHGAGLGLWPSFVRALETAPWVRDDMDRAVAAAQAAFDAFARAGRAVIEGKEQPAWQGGAAA